MREHEQRYTPARLLLRRTALLALFLMFLATVQGAWFAFEKERETDARRTDAEAELGHLKERYAELESKVGRLKTNQGVEEELRKQFNMGKPGEQLIIVVNPEAEEPGPVIQDSRPWWERLFNQ